MLAINSLIEWSWDDKSKTTERVLWLDRQQDLVYLIDIDRNDVPIGRTLTEIEAAITEGVASSLSSDPCSRLVDEEDLTRSQQEHRERAWGILEAMITVEPDIYQPRQRRDMVRQAAARFGISELTCMNYLKRFWGRGMTKNALLPDFHRCGGSGKERKSGEAKRGRPRKHTQLHGVGVNVDEHAKQIFRLALKKHYYTTAQKSLAMVYQLMRRDFYAQGKQVVNGTTLSVIMPASEVPTLGQFRYWFNKERDHRREIVTRHSAKKYEQLHRPLLGESTTEAMGPGSKYQIDATVADVYLVSRFNRNWIIGRPVVYTVIDVFSRMIAGLYVGLEGPSWAGAMMALSNAASDKVAFCKEYGVDITEADWPVHHIPDTILADRGELLGKNVESLINALNVKVQNTPPYRADWKGIVEQHFRVTNIHVKPFAPGSVDAHARERGDRDYRLDASLDIHEFTKIIIKLAVHHNNHHYLSTYTREDMMVADDIDPIPHVLWNWGIANRSGRLRTVPEELVKLHLMPTDMATVTAKGIRLKGLLYGSKTTLKERWFERARNKGSWKVKVAFDPRNMDQIYLLDVTEAGYEKCFLLNHQSRYRDKTMDEIEYLLEEERVKAMRLNEQETQPKVDVITEIEQIAKNAKKETVAVRDQGVSNKRRLDNIRDHRRLEKEANRSNECFNLTDISTDRPVNENASEKPAAKEESPEMSLLRRKQREALGRKQ